VKRSSQTLSGLKVRKLSASSAGMSIVVYGRSGTGKTTFAASAPKPMLYIDVKDHGTDSIYDVKGIDVLEVAEFADVEEAALYLSKNPQKYKTVVIDTCTQLQSLVVEEVADSNKRKRSGKSAGDWGTLTKQDWGEVSGVLKRVLQEFRDLTYKGMNVVFIAQDRTFNAGDDESEGELLLDPEVGPALSPSVAKSLNAMANVVANTYIRERKVKINKEGKKSVEKRIEYCLGVGPNPVYMRKIRKPKSVSVNESIIDPAFNDVQDIIKGA
jgi:hypothetical protein